MTATIVLPSGKKIGEHKYKHYIIELIHYPTTGDFSWRAVNSKNGRVVNPWPKDVAEVGHAMTVAASIADSSL